MPKKINLSISAIFLIVEYSLFPIIYSTLQNYFKPLQDRMARNSTAVSNELPVIFIDKCDKYVNCKWDWWESMEADILSISYNWIVGFTLIVHRETIIWMSCLLCMSVISSFAILPSEITSTQMNCVGHFIFYGKQLS